MVSFFGASPVLFPHKLEVKMVNFDWSYEPELPWGRSIRHDVKWDGSADSHEDGYLLGIASLLRILKQLVDDLDADGPPADQRYVV